MVYSYWLRDAKQTLRRLGQQQKNLKNKIKGYHKMPSRLERTGLQIVTYDNHLITYRNNCLSITKLLNEITARRKRYNETQTIKRQLEEQRSRLPILVESARNIEFHFNKKHLEIPELPMWVLKAKGETFYVHHVDFNLNISTRENPDHASTKGSIRIKKGNIKIDKDLKAEIY